MPKKLWSAPKLNQISQSSWVGSRLAKLSLVYRFNRVKKYLPKKKKNGVEKFQNKPHPSSKKTIKFGPYPSCNLTQMCLFVCLYKGGFVLST